MRPALIPLVALGVSAALGVATVQAQAIAAGDGPSSTAPREVYPVMPSDVVSPPAPLATGPIDLTERRETTTVETLAAAEAPQAAVMAKAQMADVQAASADDKVIPLGENAVLESKSAEAGEAGGGLLRTNPSLQRPNRKNLGLRFKF